MSGSRRRLCRRLRSPQGSSLAIGDNISTGPNGRVLLTRGTETILVSPNSSIGIPEKKGELSTTITQRAGTILLEVEKRNVKHFEVETPYLAAVVKGTQFRVSVNGKGTKVKVLRGQVQVADFKSGQYALVIPDKMRASRPMDRRSATRRLRQTESDPRGHPAHTGGRSAPTQRASAPSSSRNVAAIEYAVP